MLLWNAGGWQGRRLALRAVEPVYVRSIVVGRKFSQVHCERALCCRLQDLALPAPYLAVQHPAMLGTAVKLDEGTVRGEAQIRIGISGLHSVRNGKDDCCREKVG